MKCTCQELKLKTIEEMIEIQSSHGNYDYDPYMFGMANGMIYIHSILTDQQPKYLTRPEQWLKDKPKHDKLAESY